MVSDELIQKTLRLIDDPDKSEKQLLTLYRNLDSKSGLSEEQRERLVCALEKRLRDSFPKAAKRLFGAKDQQARELLSRTFSELEQRFDLSGNKVGNGVKNGGDMLSGQSHISVYISYKTPDQHAVGLGLRQATANDELKVRLRRYATGKVNSAYTPRIKEYGVDDYDKAETEFIGYVRELTIGAE